MADLQPLRNITEVYDVNNDSNKQCVNSQDTGERDGTIEAVSIAASLSFTIINRT